MVTGVHTIIFTTDPEADRAFFKDVLGLRSVDAGAGWLIFALPLAELAFHPAAESGRHEIYFLCEDIERTLEVLTSKGVEVRLPILEEDWGRVARFVLPGGGELTIYESRHPLAPS
jgi:catechol 2,3-dioxygenase-like lactoylglutathione lyase family enzyme